MDKPHPGKTTYVIMASLLPRRYSDLKKISQINLKEDSLSKERTPCLANHNHLLKSLCLLLTKQHSCLSLSEIGTVSLIYRWGNGSLKI